MRSGSVAVVLVALILGGCPPPDAERQKELAAQQAAAERALNNQRRAEIMANPARFLEASDAKIFDKGIINSYAKLTAVTIRNTAALPIRLQKGRVVWLDSSGAEVGASPLAFVGIVPSAGEKRFSEEAGTLTSGTIQGKVSKYRVEYTSIEVQIPLQN